MVSVFFIVCYRFSFFFVGVLFRSMHAWMNQMWHKYSENYSPHMWISNRCIYVCFSQIQQRRMLSPIRRYMGTLLKCLLFSPSSKFHLSKRRWQICGEEKEKFAEFLSFLLLLSSINTRFPTFTGWPDDQWNPIDDWPKTAKKTLTIKMTWPRKFDRQKIRHLVVKRKTVIH